MMDKWSCSSRQSTGLVGVVVDEVPQRKQACFVHRVRQLAINSAAKDMQIEDAEEKPTGGSQAGPSRGSR